MDNHMEALMKQESLMRFIFHLTKQQFGCYVYIFCNQEDLIRGTCVKDLMSQRQATRSIAQRQLHHFFKEGLVERESITLAEFKKRCIKHNSDMALPEGTRGYVFVYHPITYEKLLTIIKSRLEEHSGIITQLQNEEKIE